MSTNANSNVGQTEKAISKVEPPQMETKMESTMASKIETKEYLKEHLKEHLKDGGQMMKTMGRPKRSSIGSVGIAPSTQTTTKEMPPSLVPECMSNNPGEKLFDVMMFLFYCPDHEMIAVTHTDRSRCIFMPFIALSDTSSWEKQAHDGIRLIIGSQDAEIDAAIVKDLTPDYSTYKLNVFRIQLSNNSFLTRIIQCVILKKSTFRCCFLMDSQRVQWIPSKFLTEKKIQRIWGPEIQTFSTFSDHDFFKENLFASFTLKNLVFYYQIVGTWQRDMLISTGLKHMEHIVQIFNDYLEHCYPAFYMSFESFRWFMAKKGINPKDDKLPNYFNAFSSSNGEYLDFFDVLIGLVAIDPLTEQDIEGRLRFVFRFYDVKRRGIWTSEQLFKMFDDIHKARKIDINEKELRNQTLEFARSFAENTDKIKLAEFIHAGKELKIPGLESICQLEQSAITKVMNTLQKKENSKFSTISYQANKTACHSCGQKRYMYSKHRVNFDSIGRCVQPQILETDELCEGDESGKTLQEYSVEIVFGNDSFAVAILDMLRDYHFRIQQPVAEDDQRPIGLMADNEAGELFDKYINLICECLLSIFGAEQKVMKISSPVIVVGDIQGSLHDLIVLEKQYLPSFPATPTKILFLGNYAGIKSNGIECILYVFCLKILAPNKIFLIRGAHEMEHLNRRFLKAELHRKYDFTIAEKTFHNINRIFSMLPLAAIVDETIFCSHSGIPRDSKLSLLNKLPVEISNPLRDAPSAYEILTNQPIGCSDGMATLNSQAKFYIANGSPFYPQSTLKPNQTSDSEEFGANFENMDKKKTMSLQHPSKMIIKYVRMGGKTLPVPKKFSKFWSKFGKMKSLKSFNTMKSKMSSRLPSGYSPDPSIKHLERGYDFNADGFVASRKLLRSYIYDQTAIENFIKKNGFSYIVRAQFNAGSSFDYQFNGTIITTFSCTNYLNAVSKYFKTNQVETPAKEPQNSCAIVFIDKFNRCIRPIILDTKGKLTYTAKAQPGALVEETVPATNTESPTQPSLNQATSNQESSNQASLNQATLNQTSVNQAPT